MCVCFWFLTNNYIELCKYLSCYVLFIDLCMCVIDFYRCYLFVDFLGFVVVTYVYLLVCMFNHVFTCLFTCKYIYIYMVCTGISIFYTYSDIMRYTCVCVCVKEGA